MHPYSLDTPERKTIPLLLAVVAIMAAWTLNVILVRLQLTVPWWLDAPSVMGFYGLFYGFFDARLWRWSFLRSIRLVKVPVLAGQWVGTCKSSFNNHSQQFDIEANIRQAWTSIQVSLVAAESRSHSIVGSISLDTSAGPTLSYQYQSEPRSDSPTTMQIHYGTTTLAIGPDTLEGEYYSGRGRQNTGSISLRRVKSDR